MTSQIQKLNDEKAALLVQKPVEVSEQGKDASIIKGSDGNSYAVLSTGAGTTKQTEIYKIDLSKPEAEMNLNSLAGTKYTQTAEQTAADKAEVTGVSNAEVRKELQRLIALERKKTSSPDTTAVNPNSEEQPATAQPGATTKPETTPAKTTPTDTVVSPTNLKPPIPPATTPPVKPSVDSITVDGIISAEEKQTFVTWMKDPALKEYFLRYNKNNKVTEENGVITIETPEKVKITMETTTGNLTLSHADFGDITKNPEAIKKVEENLRKMIETYLQNKPK